MTLRQEATAEKERPKSMRYTRLIVKQLRDTGIEVAAFKFAIQDSAFDSLLAVMKL